MRPGDALPELRVTPAPDVTERYAEASGDHNPIHLDEEFARSVGLPGRILHGLWTMAQVARAQTSAAGGPGALQALSVQFRGLGVPGEEIAITSTVKEADGHRVIVETEAVQGDRRLVRRGRAVLRRP
jgi:acyl dehydratase